MGRLGTILSSAFVVVVVGAVLSFVFGYAAQQVAREWQQEDKRLDVRTALVQRVSETSADFIGIVRLQGIGGTDDSQLDAAYRKWALGSSSIGSELRAYVRSDDVQRRWRDYRTNMANVYYFFREEDAGLQRYWLKRLAGYWGPENPAGAFLVLDGLLTRPASREYRNSLRELLDRTEQRSENIVRLILEAPTNI
jgi:hypothetical protein